MRRSSGDLDTIVLAFLGSSLMCLAKWIDDGIKEGPIQCSDRDKYFDDVTLFHADLFSLGKSVHIYPYFM